MRLLFSPLIPLILYLGLSITTLHHEIQFLVNNHFELLVFIWTIISTFLHFFENKNEVQAFYQQIQIPFFLIFGLILTPAVTSFFSADYFTILNDGEYKTLVKILCICPLIFYFLKSTKMKDWILNSVLVFYTVFAFYFLYRFFVLHEARDFDLRPTLHIRHGDPNFLCLFFSMMAPLSFLKMQSFFKQKNYIRSSFSFLSGLLFIYCAFITESRMGLIALFVGLAALFLTSQIQKIVKFFSLICLVAMVAFVANQSSDLTNRFSDIKDKSSTDRILTYENGLKSFITAPIFGVGMHAAKKTYYENSKFPDFQTNSKRLEIHSTYLNILAELGSVGFLIFCGLLIWCFHQIFKCQSKDKYFLLSSFVIMLLSMLTIGVAYKDLVYLHLFLLAGLAQNSESYD